MDKKKLLGNVRINTFKSARQVLELLKTILREQRKTNLFFLNDNGFNISQKDSEYLQILNQADLLLNDGLGVKLGAKIWGIHLNENLNGTDLIPRLFEICERHGWPIYLLGAQSDSVQAAASHLSRIFPRLIIAGFHSGYFEQEEKIVDKINQSGAAVLLVGMGMPLQEKFISRHTDSLKPILRVAAGGYIDFASEMKPRAPKWMRRLNLEWLFRMMLEPRRMWRRNVIGHLQFFIRVLALKKRR